MSDTPKFIPMTERWKLDASDFLQEVDSLSEFGGHGSGYSKEEGHKGRPGKVGGSTKSSQTKNDIDSKFDDVISFMKNEGQDIWSNDSIERMKNVSRETSELYEKPSSSDGVDIWTTNTSTLWYGEHPYRNGQRNPIGDKLQEEIMNSPLPRDEILYRGVHGSYAKSLLDTKVGDEFTLSNTKFSSTSRSLDVAISFQKDFGQDDGALMVIDAPAGSPALYAHDLASEFLLPAGATFKVVDKVGNSLHLLYTGVNSE